MQVWGSQRRSQSPASAQVGGRAERPAPGLGRPQAGREPVQWPEGSPLPWGPEGHRGLGEAPGLSRAQPRCAPAGLVDLSHVAILGSGEAEM